MTEIAQTDSTEFSQDKEDSVSSPYNASENLKSSDSEGDIFTKRTVSKSKKTRFVGSDDESDASNVEDKIRKNSNDSSSNLQDKLNDSGSEDEIFSKSKTITKSKVRNFVESENDSETSIKDDGQKENEDLFRSDDSSKKSAKSSPIKKKKRIIRQSNSDSGDTESDYEENVVQSSRIKDKMAKFTEKFKKRFTKSKTSPNKDDKSDKMPDVVTAHKSTISNLYDSESSGDDEERKSNSEDEKCSQSDGETRGCVSLGSIKKTVLKDSKPKVQRMSAKQAMEQMHKIKSESSRMLREKDVSLPYHRPKQVSLKDILAKKNISLVPGNKRMGFKMNEDQLKIYEQQLKEREKDMLELCKSESESDEAEGGNNAELITNGDSKSQEIVTLTKSPQDPRTSNEMPIQILNACKNLLSALDKEDKSNKEETTIAIDGTDKLESSDVVLSYDTEENIDDDLIKMANETQDTNLFTETGEDTEMMEVPTILSSNVNNTKIGNLEPGFVKSPSAGQEFETDKAQGSLEIDTENSYSEIDYVNGNSNKQCPSNETISRSNFLGVNFKTQSEDTSEPSTSVQHISCSVPLPTKKPKLTGSPGCFIDLISGEVQSGVEMLKKKYLIHAAMKTPEEIEREKERRIHPGSSLLKLKRDLEDKMTDQRTLEWTKRLEEMALKKKEENDNLSDCEELLEKEEFENCGKEGDVENKEDDDEKDSESEGESEPEENDVLLTKPTKAKDPCAFIDEEAEVEEDDDAGSADEDEDEDSSSDDSGDDLEQPTQEKKTLTRIIKPADSDSSDDESINKNDEAVNVALLIRPDANEADVSSTPMKKDRALKPTQSEDLFESEDIPKNDSYSLDWEDDMPLGQKPALPNTTPLSLKKSDHSFSEPSCNVPGRSDLSSLVSPIIKLTAVQRMSSGNASVDQTPSPRLTPSSPKYKSPHEADKFANLQKKLLFESDTSETIQDTQELENLCSGKFPSQDLQTASCKPTDITMSAIFHNATPTVDGEMSQNTENELMELCTGKFAGINDNEDRAVPNEPANKKEDSENISLVWSEAQNTETIENAISITTTFEKLEKLPEMPNFEVSKDQCATLNNARFKDKSITSFFKSDSKESNIEIKPSDGSKQMLSSVNVASVRKKFTILTSSEEDNVENENVSLKKKVLKSRKEREKKRKQIKISDDEESEEEDQGSEKSFEDEEETDRLVDYDSEENEIVVENEMQEKPKKKKMASEFFDQEAELTSEDEWRASGDEDERGMDRMEREEGDADQFDQHAMKKQLERIHLRQILDDDKREVQMLQEMLLEDDMEGGTRERKFKWKNIDNSVEAGAAALDDDLDGGLDDLQSEEQWRKQRHERETFLGQLMEKENSQANTSQGSEKKSCSFSRNSFTKSSLVKISKTVDDTSAEVSKISNGNCEKDTGEGIMTMKRINNDLPLPVKKPFLMQNNARGSFLSRGQAAMNRLALLTKNGPAPQDSEEPTNMSSLAPGKKKNFVFATVSPPCNDSLNEETKMMKRKATSQVSTPVLIKKIKIAEKTSKSSRKSLLDHLE